LGTLFESLLVPQSVPVRFLAYRELDGYKCGTRNPNRCNASVPDLFPPSSVGVPTEFRRSTAAVPSQCLEYLSSTVGVPLYSPFTVRGTLAERK